LKNVNDGIFATNTWGNKLTVSENCSFLREALPLLLVNSFFKDYSEHEVLFVKNTCKDDFAESVTVNSEQVVVLRVWSTQLFIELVFKVVGSSIKPFCVPADVLGAAGSTC